MPQETQVTAHTVAATGSSTGLSGALATVIIARWWPQATPADAAAITTIITAVIASLTAGTSLIIATCRHERRQREEEGR